METEIALKYECTGNAKTHTNSDRYVRRENGWDFDINQTRMKAIENY